MIRHQIIEPNTPVFVAVGQFWLQQIRQIEKQIEKLRKQDADHDQSETVHDLRVAVRKSQSLALAFAPYIPGKWPERIRHELRPLRKTCEVLRDLDVLVDWVVAFGPQQTNLEVLLADLQHQQAEATEDVLKALLDKQNLSMLKRLRSKLELALDEAQNANHSRVPLTQPQYRLADVAAPALLTRAADLTAWRANWLNAASASEQTPQIGILHQLRIAGKHFRYTLDFLSPVIPELSPDLAQSFAAIQTLLGDLHDRIQFRAFLKEQPVLQRLTASLQNQLMVRISLEEAALLKGLQPHLDQLTPAWFQTQICREQVFNNTVFPSESHTINT